jgi:hypothetical protein
MWEVTTPVSGHSSIAKGTKMFIRLELNIQMTEEWKITEY